MKIFFRRALQLVAGLRLGRHQANNCICRTKPKYKAPSSDIEGASARSMHNIRDILPGHYREISRTNYFSIAKKTIHQLQWLSFLWWELFFMLHSKHSVFFFHFAHHVNVLLLGLIAADTFLAVPCLPFRAASLKNDMKRYAPEML